MVAFVDDLTNNLGRGLGTQISINIEINKNEIHDLFQKNKEKIDELLKKNKNKYIENLWVYFFEKQKFIFPLNKQNEIYINYHKSNLEHIFRYINFRYIFYLASFKKINHGYPPYLLIEPVSACNLRCPFCFQTDKTFTRKPYMGVMDLSLFKKVVDEADLLGVGAVTIASRGEPTLHKKLKDMLRYLDTKKNIFEKKMNTNGAFLTEELCYEIFNSNLTQIVISADHYEKETFEKLRKNANFEKILNNVDMLFNIREKINNPITEIRVSGVDYYQNTDRKKFYDFWINRSDHVSMGNALERWDTYFNAEHPDINDPCENLWDRMYVWFDGKVNPCDADYKSYLSYGNVKDHSIKNVWESKIIKKIREDHLKGCRNKINPCNKCGVTFTE